MSCNCGSSGRQGTQYCQECLPSIFEWLVPVKDVPDPFLMDRNHAYITPDNSVYVLDHDRVVPLDIGGFDKTQYYTKKEIDTLLSAFNSYKQGDGIIIASDGTISLDKSVIPDNYVKSIEVNKENNVITLNYSYVDGTVQSVSFEDSDTKVLAYDDTDLKNRVKALETNSNGSINEDIGNFREYQVDGDPTTNVTVYVG